MKIKQWLLDNYELQTIKEITEHGCISGICNDLIYYSDTVKFHDEHEVEIWQFLYEDSEDNDMNIPELIASLNGAKDVGSIEQFKNLLAWYAVERVAEMIVYEKESEEEVE